MNDTIDPDVTTTPTDATLETSDTDAQDISNNSDDLAAKIAELEEKNRKLYARLKREEKKETPTQPQAKADGIMSQFDLIALMKADVTETDDINEVIDYAKHKGIPVADALKSNVVRTILADKREERETLRATSIKGSAKGVAKVSGETLLAQAQKGNLPDEGDFDALLSARYGK